jgi:hypothetical protein
MSSSRPGTANRAGGKDDAVHTLIPGIHRDTFHELKLETDAPSGNFLRHFRKCAVVKSGSASETPPLPVERQPWADDHRHLIWPDDRQIGQWLR